MGASSSAAGVDSHDETSQGLVRGNDLNELADTPFDENNSLTSGLNLGKIGSLIGQGCAVTLILTIGILGYQVNKGLNINNVTAYTQAIEDWESPYLYYIVGSEYTVPTVDSEQPAVAKKEKRKPSKKVRGGTKPVPNDLSYVDVVAYWPGTSAGKVDDDGDVSAESDDEDGNLSPVSGVNQTTLFGNNFVDPGYMQKEIEPYTRLNSTIGVVASDNQCPIGTNPCITAMGSSSSIGSVWYPPKNQTLCFTEENSDFCPAVDVEIYNVTDITSPPEIQIALEDVQYSIDDVSGNEYGELYLAQQFYDTTLRTSNGIISMLWSIGQPCLFTDQSPFAKGDSMPKYYPTEYQAQNKTCQDNYPRANGESPSTAFDYRYWKVSDYEFTQTMWDVRTQNPATTANPGIVTPPVQSTISSQPNYSNYVPNAESDYSQFKMSLWARSGIYFDHECEHSIFMAINQLKLMQGLNLDSSEEVNSAAMAGIIVFAICTVWLLVHVVWFCKNRKQVGTAYNVSTGLQSGTLLGGSIATLILSNEAMQKVCDKNNVLIDWGNMFSGCVDEFMAINPYQVDMLTNQVNQVNVMWALSIVAVCLAGLSMLVNIYIMVAKKD